MLFLWSILTFFRISLLLAVVCGYNDPSFTYSTCVDYEFKEILKNMLSVKIIYDDQWPTCDKISGRNHVIADHFGCFYVKIFNGSVPDGIAYRLRGPLAILKAGVDGIDMRNRAELFGFQLDVSDDGTRWVFAYCSHNATCFTDSIGYADHATGPQIPSKPALIRASKAKRMFSGFVDHWSFYPLIILLFVGIIILICVLSHYSWKVHQTWNNCSEEPTPIEQLLTMFL